MSKEKEYYYTIVRKYYGLSFTTDLSEVEDCFCFETEAEAEKCIKDIFNNGEWMQDERHGKIRHYAERREVKHTMYCY